MFFLKYFICSNACSIDAVTSCLPYLSDTWIKTYLNVHIPASSFICMLWTINFTNTSDIKHVALPFLSQNAIKRIFLMNIWLLSTVDYPQNFTNSFKNYKSDANGHYWPHAWQHICHVENHLVTFLIIYSYLYITYLIQYVF